MLQVAARSQNTDSNSLTHSQFKGTFFRGAGGGGGQKTPNTAQGFSPQVANNNAHVTI